jgi:CubicO group peptidase (beta-lactamase class C family)
LVIARRAALNVAIEGLCIFEQVVSLFKITVLTELPVKANSKLIAPICAVLITLTSTLSSQSLPDSIIKKIDSLYLKWNKPGSPGCTVGIVRNDSLIYSKGYGMANLEYSVPNTPETIFHMASVSKQFTAFSIILLERAGKLKLDDDVHKYLPWFPDLKEKITIQNLLNHTSGIRDQWQLLAIAGTRLEDVITQAQIVKILGKQQALNFKPGEKYSYSNSGFTMLAEIVKSITGQTLRKFTDSAIFKPLGMSSTHFHDDCSEVVTNRSYSYERIDSAHFSNSILSYSNAGATSLFTNVVDMSKWVENFYDHKVGDQKDIDVLVTKGKLTTGKELSYANGIAVDTYKGWRQYAHSGGDAGYRTYLSVLPDLKMGFMVFSNLGDIDPGSRVYEMAQLLVKDTTVKKEAVKKPQRDSLAAIIKDSSAIKKYLGDYIGEDGLPLNLVITNSKLYFHIYNSSNFLVQDGKDSFSIHDAPEVKFILSINAADTIVDIITTDNSFHLKKYIKDTSQTDATLQAYTGTYYCPELDCSYGIQLKDHGLILTNPKYNDTKLTLVNANHLTNDYWWINHLNMLRDKNKKIIGFEVNSGRIMHVRFDKIE